MAHQWFGDLVTMRWWDDIWLNEGFATWMASKPLKAWKSGVAHGARGGEVEPEGDGGRLAGDHQTHSLQGLHPAEISEVFDAIAYEKGAAVLRMVESWVGEEAFRKGVNAYIDKFKYGNAAAEDFWGTLTTSTGKPVDRVMAGFVDQPGVPRIDAALKCTDGRGTATVGEEKVAAGSANGHAWTVPVCARTPDGKTTCALAAGAPASIPLDTCADWVVANAGARGYYRVVNPPTTLRALAANLKSLEPPERLALIADEWALVLKRRHDIAAFMDVASGFKTEQSAAVVETLVGSLKQVGDNLTTQGSRPAYRAWLTALLSPGLAQVGWSPAASESDDTRALRAWLVAGLGETAGSPAVIAKSRSLVLEELAKPGSIESTLLNEVVTVAARHGDAALYDKYLARSRAAQNPEEHYRYAYGLTQFSDPALVRKTMDYIVGPEVRSQDVKLLISSLLQNPDARQLSWPLIRDRWAEVQKRSGDLVFGGNGVVITALGTFCDSRTRQDVAKFFAAHKVPDATRTLQQALERIDEMFSPDDDATGDADGMARRSPAGCDGSDRRFRGKTAMTSRMRRTVPSTRGDRACDSARRRPAGRNRPAVCDRAAVRNGAAARDRAAAGRAGERVRNRPRRHGPESPGVHRLLPVRLRRLDGQPPAPCRSGAVRQVRRVAGAQQCGPSRHPRGRGRLAGGSRRDQDRRLLRQLHGRIRDRGEGNGTAEGGRRPHCRVGRPR